MIIHGDLRDLLRLLNDHGVDYVVVGGYAVAFHGFVRATKDIDLFYRNTSENIARLRSALATFGIPKTQMDSRTFSQVDSIVRIGTPPGQVELFNRIPGLTFDGAWRNKVEGQYGGISVSFVSREDLIASKRATSRPQDLRDIEELGDSS